MNFKKEKKQG